MLGLGYGLGLGLGLGLGIGLGLGLSFVGHILGIRVGFPILTSFFQLIFILNHDCNPDPNLNHNPNANAIT
jgi:hypothetical protein